ncbi:MAG TPA: DUF1385 domain-containing protein [Solirubrobacteraceae bacterium]|nr:DUF1385 domain-containing protein [Solirubrobacteraceae bacterium]
MTAATPEGKLRLGGMALRNGLLVHGPTHWAVACRRDDGSIGIASGRKPKVRGVENVPGLRGIARLGEAMAVIPLAKRALPEARLPFADARVLGAVAAASLSVRALRAGGRGGRPVTEVGAAVISLAPSIIALRGGDLAAYHGVEHKAIAAYERDDADAADAAKEHDRCGSHLMAPLLTANVAGAALVSRIVERPGPAHHALVTLGSMGAAVEVFAWAERNPDSPVTHALRVPGHELQRLLGTREPTETQLEVGRAALAEILRVEGEPA